MKSLYGNGKLLLTAEYVVLDGALALALPTSFGQSLTIETNNSSTLIWKSLDEKGRLWFEGEFKLQYNALSLLSTNDTKIASRLLDILNAAMQLHSKFLNENKGYCVTSKLDFPRHWGLGSSSTLISTIANWAKVDPYALLELTFGGSGYDIACAQHDTAITYQLNSNEHYDAKYLKQHDKRSINEVIFQPKFKEHLYFVHLNKKQNSRDAIAAYRKNTSNLKQEIEAINQITLDMIDCTTLKEFEDLIIQHEEIISQLINIPPVKTRLFNDFNGSIKSLGAWGGDFALVATNENPKAYFKDQGFNTLLSYADMIL